MPRRLIEQALCCGTGRIPKGIPAFETESMEILCALGAVALGVSNCEKGESLEVEVKDEPSLLLIRLGGASKRGTEGGRNEEVESWLPELEATEGLSAAFSSSTALRVQIVAL